VPLRPFGAPPHCDGEAKSEPSKAPHRNGFERPENSPVDCSQWFERPENSPVDCSQRERAGRPPSNGPAGPGELSAKQTEGHSEL